MALSVEWRRGSIVTLIELLVVLTVIAVLSVKFLKLYVRSPAPQGSAPAGNDTAVVDAARVTLNRAQESQNKRLQGLDMER